MTFKGAVEEVVEIRDGYRDGLQVLKSKHRSKIVPNESRDLTGSINLDEALKEYYPNAPRWDYGIGIKHNGVNENTIWIEVHPSSSAHVQDVLNKVDWLRKWLLEKAAPLQRMTRGSKGFVWISSGKVALQRGSPQLRRVAAAGVHFAGERFPVP